MTVLRAFVTVACRKGLWLRWFVLLHGLGSAGVIQSLARLVCCLRVFGCCSELYRCWIERLQLVPRLLRQFRKAHNEVLLKLPSDLVRSEKEVFIQYVRYDASYSVDSIEMIF